MHFRISPVEKNRVLVTHADDNNGSKAFSSVCMCQCLKCPHVKTVKSKTAETKITKLGTWIVHRESSTTK